MSNILIFSSKDYYDDCLNRVLMLASFIFVKYSDGYFIVKNRKGNHIGFIGTLQDVLNWLTQNLDESAKN